MSNFWAGGVGESVGDDLATLSPIYASGNIWFVQSTTGTDAASPAGRLKNEPLDTLNQANTNAASGDLIYLLSAHTETRTSAITITKSLTIVGCGTTSGKPAPQLINNSAAASLFTINTAGICVEFRNIYFPAQTQSCSATKFSNGQGNLRFVGCYFEANVFDAAAVITIPATGTESTFEFINCTMISTGTSTSSQPLVGISGTSHTAHVRLDGSTFSNGLYGWSGGSAVTITAAGSTETIRGVGVNRLLGATLSLPATRTWVTDGTVTGGGRIVI
jgi:hypothetical protein